MHENLTYPVNDTEDGPMLMPINLYNRIQDAIELWAKRQERTLIEKRQAGALTLNEFSTAIWVLETQNSEWLIRLDKMVMGK